MRRASDEKQRTCRRREIGSNRAIINKGMILTMAKATKKTPTDSTLTLKEIGVSLADQFEMPKSHALQIMAETVTMMQKQLKKGGKVRISGLGILQVKKTAARKGVNPSTGEAMKIKAGKRLKFSADRGFKAAL